jgi:hypothetical protein
MTDLEKAKEWIKYGGLSEYGRLELLMAALNDGERVFDLCLKELEIKTPRDLMVWAWSAEKANTAWMQRWPFK